MGGLQNIQVEGILPSKGCFADLATLQPGYLCADTESLTDAGAAFARDNYAQHPHAFDGSIEEPTAL
jgi:hypothetical protein